MRTTVMFGSTVQGRGVVRGAVNPNGVDFAVSSGLGDIWHMQIDARGVVELMEAANLLEAVVRDIDRRVTVLREIGEART